MLKVAGSLILLILERWITSTQTLSIWEWISIQTFIFFIAPMLLIVFFRVNRKEFGLSMGKTREGLRYVVFLLVLALPFMLYGAHLSEFKHYYPIWEPARSSISNFILFELAVLVMMFNTEFFFRGLLLFSLKNWSDKHGLSPWTAIIAHSLVYMLAHIGKPTLEVPYSFIVGLVFGWLALRTRSIFPSLTAHWTSSVLFDVFVILI